MVEVIAVLAGLATIGAFLIKPVLLFFKKIKKDKLPQKNDAVGERKNDVLEAKRLEKRAEVAENLITVARKIQDAMHVIRSGWFSVPADKANDELYFYEQRYERLAEYNDLFEKLRDIQIKVKTIIDDVEVEQAVENLFSARHRIRVAIESLIMYAKLNDDGEYRVAIKELKEILLEDINETDATSQKINNAIKTIQTRLTPIVQMNE